MRPPFDRRHIFAALTAFAVLYLYYRYRSESKKRKCIKNKDDDDNVPTVTTKFDTTTIPLKPPCCNPVSRYKFDVIHDTPSPRHLDEVSLHEEDYKHDHHDINTIKVVTFNVLASCYAGKSTSYQSHCSPEHLDAEYRFTEIGKILHHCNADIIALQEVDQINASLKWMNLQQQHQSSNLYRIFYSKRTGKKQDGLLLAFKSSKYRLYRNEPLRVIKLNDLTLGCGSENSVQYFKKHQIAMCLVLQPLHDPTHLLIVVNTHLYWHPEADDMRLRQISYILNIVHSKAQRLQNEQSTGNQSQSDSEKIKKISLIFCGDFNTLPLTAPHDFVLNGFYTMKAPGNSSLKLIMDASLNKVARWCRALGVDTAYFKDQQLMETEIAEKLFKICRDQDRILVTQSKSLVARKNCPPHLLVLHHRKDSKSKSNSSSSSKEKDSDNKRRPFDGLKQIIKYFGIEYDDDAIFTRCTLCNGDLREMEDRKEIENEEQIPKTMKAPDRIEQETFWRCLSCSQVYWLGFKAKNEIEKFKRIFAENALEMEKDHRERKERLERRLKKERMKKMKKEKMEEKKSVDREGEEYESDIGDLEDKLKLIPNVQRFFWEDVRFENVFGDRMQSAYWSVHGKAADYTNKTSTFQGCLDYIFYADVMDNNSNTKESGLECTNAQLMEGDKTAYPNSSWPSDHILLMATFQMH